MTDLSNQNLSELDMAKMQLAFVQDEIANLEEEEKDLKTLIAELSAQESDNPHWTAADSLLTRMPERVDEVKQMLLDSGDRGEAVWVAQEPVYNISGMFASLTEEIAPDTMRMYVEAQSRHWHGYLTSGLILAECFTPEGVKIEGKVIPWWGNFGPYKATMYVQNDWARDSKIAAERSRAARNIRSQDFYYRMAQLGGTVDEFMEKYPHYIPE